MGEVRVELEIAAPPSDVWDVLSDIEGWASWNEVMACSRSDGGLGGRVHASVAVGPIWFPVRSILGRWDPERALGWGEDRGFIARIHHGFELAPSAKGTRVIHYETFEGLVGRLVFPLVQASLTRNYAAFLEALKSRVEAR